MTRSDESLADDDTLKFYVAGDDGHGHAEGGTMIGFWLYLMSDCLIFAALFACYAVYGHAYAAGPSPATLFKLETVALNTALLLFSSITYGFAMLCMEKGWKGNTLFWMLVTALFGMGFVYLELHEFADLIAEGAGPQRSAFLSSFFTLVGTHGLHVSVGILWMFVLMVQVMWKGLVPENKRRLMCLSMFWHFLDVVWIGVFSFVYLVSVLP
ncbi:cytochrome o ubiquinol oxidase subunit III [Lichenibacterium ramalinae]|uniref:Cytochrome bo(3) ubiquinol oxidase subunit 3 n=1 Tax=Lichenibacterium ramalinae TaxID=2316527 RepID=A0A4Q2R5T7_9HYPH|nr:cytochrome o ubiquinol oxidase subunit III [Lichenibacterium ramalinae]